MEHPASHETIYQYIWRDKACGGSLWNCLRQSTKQRRKRYNTYDSRGRLTAKRPIYERPSSIESRKIKGCCEIDTVMGRGSEDCIITLVERRTGYPPIGKLEDRTTRSLNKKCIQMIKNEPAPFTSVTADNGTEFHQYKSIEKATSIKCYFVTPITPGREDPTKIPMASFVNIYRKGKPRRE